MKYFNVYINRFCSLKHLLIFSLLTQLWINSGIYTSFEATSTKDLLHSTGSIFLCSLTWVSLLAMIPYRRIRTIATVVSYFVFIGMFLFEKFLVYTYNSLFTEGVAINILVTNPKEATSFIESSNLSVLLTPLIFVLILCASVLMISYLWDRYWSNSIKNGRPIMVTYLITYLLVGTSLFLSKNVPYHVMSPFERLSIATHNCIESIKETERKTQELRSADIGQITNDFDLGDTNVIVVMGETASRKYMHCYGYPLSNTPLLDSIISQGNTILFSDVLSPYPLTAIAVPRVLSFFQQENEQSSEWYEYPTLPLVMSKAGYYTYWLSNQESSGMGSPISSLAGTSDSVRFLDHRADMVTPISYDEALLPHLQNKADAIKHGRKAFGGIIHIMGSHDRYRDRFPNTYQKFSTNDLPSKSPYNTVLPKEKGMKQNIADYVNTI